jgi:glyoxylase-like metal-dependent hydrolase (beta-lactamase superfamily II)
VLERLTFDDVTAFRLSWWRSRAIGYSVHVYVVRGVLIDTGYPAAHREVAQIVRETHAVGAYVTHHHEDHAGNVSRLVQHGLPLAMHPDTLALVRHPHRIGLYRHLTWQAMRGFDTPVTPLHDDTLQLVATPGHAPDHHAVWDATTGTLFAGDLYLGVKVKLAHSYESPAQHVASLEAMIARGPSRVFCAHRGLVSDGVNRLRAKAEWMRETMERVLSLHRDGRSVGEVRAELLGARDSTHWVSAGDYSPDNFVRAVLRDAGAG